MSKKILNHIKKEFFSFIGLLFSIGMSIYGYKTKKGFNMISFSVTDPVNHYYFIPFVVIGMIGIIGFSLYIYSKN